MREIKLLLLFVVLLCSKALHCQDTILVPTQKLDIKMYCYYINANGLITTEDEFKKNVVKLSKPHFATCDTLCLPEINFKQYNLIGITTGGAHIQNVLTFLYKIKSQKKYVFVIKLVEDGVDPTSVGEFIQINELAAKFEKDYTFEYKTVKEFVYYKGSKEPIEVYIPNKKCIYPQPKGK